MTHLTTPSRTTNATREPHTSLPPKQITTSRRSTRSRPTNATREPKAALPLRGAAAGRSTASEASGRPEGELRSHCKEGARGRPKPHPATPRLLTLLALCLLCLACTPQGGQHPASDRAQAQGAGLPTFKQGKAKRQFGTTLLDLTSGAVSFDLYKRGDDFLVVARNTHHGTVTADFQLTTTNLKPTKPYSSTVELPAGGPQAPSYVVATYTYADRSQPWRATIKAHGQIGTRTLKHDPTARYLLPYRAGERYKVLQGPGGSFSHFGAMEHAIDFDMPIGVTVTAMRAGKVAFSHDRATSGANDPNLAKEASNSNFVAIEHDDGTLMMYGHLTHRGVLVTPGQRVTAGQPIGLSGDTGFVSQPHLHVALQIAQDAYTPRTLPLPILLRKKAKQGTILTQGERHTAFAAP